MAKILSEQTLNELRVTAREMGVSTKGKSKGELYDDIIIKQKELDSAPDVEITNGEISSMVDMEKSSYRKNTVSHPTNIVSKKVGNTKEIDPVTHTEKEVDLVEIFVRVSTGKFRTGNKYHSFVAGRTYHVTEGMRDYLAEKGIL